MRLPMTLLLLLAFTGCADTAHKPAPGEAQVGQNCIVYFRRDSLGMAADLPASPLTGSVNGAEVEQAGQLMSVSADWIVINLHGRVFHIPQAAILMIEFGSNITQAPGLGQPVEPHPVDHGDHTHAGEHPAGDHSAH